MPSDFLPEPALVVLVGASGAGKSTWAAARYEPNEIISSDRLRAVVGHGEDDLDASADAFALMDLIVTARLGRRLTIVVDTIGFSGERRHNYLGTARRVGIPAIAVLFDTDPAVCRIRNKARARPIPHKDIESQLQRMPEVARQVATEGWHIVHTIRTDESGTSTISLSS
jgi:predicted kinase